MREFIGQHFNHFLALLVLVSRIGDIGTTYLATPTLALEANPIARRFGWRFALATLVVAGIPYYSRELGVMVATMSLLVSASNASKVMAARAMGEQAYLQLSRQVVAGTGTVLGICFILLPSAFYALLGGVMLLFFPGPEAGWGCYFAGGILAYAFAIVLWGTHRFLMLKRKARAAAGGS